MNVKIIDSTLREGRQSIFFDTILAMQDEYLGIIARLGVSDIEYRNPSINESELKIYKTVKEKFPNLKFHLHIFLNKKNIDWAIHNPSVDNISTFIKLPLTETSREDLMSLVQGTPKKIRIGIESVSLVSDDILKDFLNLIKNEESVDRIAFSDTLGNFTPKAMNSFLQRINLVGLNGKDLEFHLHNDYGLAAANAVEVLSQLKMISGNVYLSTSMFGIGERNGILSYGDILSNMVRLQVPHSLDFKVYGELVELMKRNNVLFNRDPLSSTSFSHFATSHIIGETADNYYHTILPGMFGMHSKLIFNFLTGEAVFKHISENILKEKVFDDGTIIKDYFLMRMEESNCNFFLYEDVLAMLHEFYSRDSIK